MTTIECVWLKRHYRRFIPDPRLPIAPFYRRLNHNVYPTFAPGSALCEGFIVAIESSVAPKLRYSEH